MRSTNRILFAVALFSLSAASLAAQQEAARKIVIIAGVKSHGPEGNGIHDYPWSARLIKAMLETSNVRERVRVEIHLNGWPADAKQLEDAAAVMIISDGRDGDRYREAPHLASPERVKLVDSLVDRGCGILVFHFSTFAPDALGEKALDWYGGHFDWETDGERDWYSKITTQESSVAIATPGHPVVRGVEPFKLREEFYHDIRFRRDDDEWSPIWTVADLPSEKPNGDVVAWVIERKGGHRGFATTCGHFYDNWKNDDFRRTVLNALVWAARVPVPQGGVEAEFLTRERISKHLKEPELLDAIDEDARAAEEESEEFYADRPYWYKPGHPLQPAAPASIQTLPGFRVERMLTVPREWGSWTAITVDGRGRLICAAQHRPGLHRVTPPAIEGSPSDPEVERLGGVAEKMGWSHGLLAAFDSLYVTVSGGNSTTGGGVYRLRDTDGDDQYDEVSRLFELNVAGEHGPHGMVAGPQGKWLYMICGNGTKLPDGVAHRAPSRTDGVDHLLPPGFESSRHTAAGFVLRFRPDGAELELVSSGLRNSYDLAFNEHGDLFTFDSDMEWDLGAPWYRPTRICHLVTGGEFGWRGDAAKWPEYYEDSVAPVINVGPASPTGVVFGHAARFPAKYRRALYACDWTFATIHAVHIEPRGAAYHATIEEFVGGQGLPVTDIAVGGDGALYFIVGGRRLGSALYRVRYTGESIGERPAAGSLTGEAGKLHELRRRLERFHGRRRDAAIDEAWPHLGHDDRAIRFAARVAVESQPVKAWRERALAETDTVARTVALLALARKDHPQRQRAVLRSLASIDAAQETPEGHLRMLRACELALARGGPTVEKLRDATSSWLRELFPATDPRVNRELASLLCFLGDRSMIGPLLEHMADDGGERPLLGSGYFVRNKKYGQAIRDILQAAPLVDRMHFAQMLLWIEGGWSRAQRTEYFRLIADAQANTKGGHRYVEIWERIREVALEQVPEVERATYERIRAPQATSLEESKLPRPQGPGKDWTLDELLGLVQKRFRDRDHASGRKMYSAARCVTCHRFNGEGGSVGPDLSSIGQRFTLRDILDATLNPSKAVSDQYRVSMVLTSDGHMLSGRIVARDDRKLDIATNLNRPGQTTSIPLVRIADEHPVPISTMPENLLDPLGADEILDLLAYLISGGDARHPIFEP